MSEKRILAGEISTAHGIRGLVKIRSFVEDGSLLEDGDVFTGESGQAKINLTLKNVLKGDWLAEVEGVSDRNAAERLRGTKLYIERDKLPTPADGEYYIEDMKNMAVKDESGAEIGRLSAVVNYGAGDMFDIRLNNGQEITLPFTDETVLNVDIVGRSVTVKIPDVI